jgi:hypothetical protein
MLNSEDPSNINHQRIRRIGWSHRPTWLPGTPVEIGTVGIMKDVAFVPGSSPAQLGIPSTVSRISDGQLDSTSMGSTTVSFKAAGELNDQFQVLTKADAGALVEFSRERAVVIQMRKVTSRRIVPGDLKKWRLC